MITKYRNRLFRWYNVFQHSCTRSKNRHAVCSLQISFSPLCSWHRRKLSKLWELWMENMNSMHSGMLIYLFGIHQDNPDQNHVDSRSQRMVMVDFIHLKKYKPVLHLIHGSYSVRQNRKKLPRFVLGKMYDLVYHTAWLKAKII